MTEYDQDFEYGVSMARMADMQTDYSHTGIEPENALSKKQREAILRRDNHHSQMRHYSEEKGWYKNINCPYDGRPCSSLQVHHIKPRRAGGKDEPTNLITVSECEHVGRCRDNRIK